jgi:DNA-binding NtrC family response regulator
MKAVRYSTADGSRDALRCRIDLLSPATLAASTASPVPAVYVLLNDDIDNVARRADLASVVLDRGRKHPRKQLAAVLLGRHARQRIPIIRGSYTVAGQLTRSVRAFLGKASRSAHDRRAYLIGADAAVFETIWHSAGPPAGRRGDSASADPGRAGTPHEESARRVLDLLAPIPVPPALEQRYVGTSPSIQLVRQLIMLAAQSDEPVLVLGETGTGKEIVARSIHEYGSRRAKPFIAVNCGAIPAELFESELFGHLPGAFTGAVARRIGLWELAQGGTLFLDEIGDLRSDHQAKILRALQERSIRPLGGTRETEVDVRVIAATNRELYTMVRTGDYREDLYYRLRSFLIRTPSLREHPSDIPGMAEYFWTRMTGSAGTTLGPDLLGALSAETWPGNARELRSVLAQLDAMFRDADLSAEHLEAVHRLHGHALRRAVPHRAEPGLRRLRSRAVLLRLEDVVRACRATLQYLGSEKADDLGIDRLSNALSRRIDELRSILETIELAAGRTTITEATLDSARLMQSDLIEISIELDVDPASARRSWRHHIAERMDALLDAIREEVAAVDQG